MELILVRHGETDWNRDERVQGVSDITLNEVGREQARKLALALKDRPIRRIYSSPLCRAYETTRIINDYHHLPIEVREELREMDQGRFEGLPFRELMATEREFLIHWLEDPASVIMPGGESLADVQKRVRPVIEDICAAGVDSLIISHNFTIAAIICDIAGIPLSRFRQVSVAPASLSIIRLTNGKGELEKLNDRGHLA